MYKRIILYTPALRIVNSVPFKCDGGITGAILGAIAAVGATATNAAMQNAAMTNDYDIWKESKDWQEGMMGRQQQWAREDALTAYQRQRDLSAEIMEREQNYNSPANQLKLMREAGINPNSMQAGSWTLNGQSASVNPVSTVTGGAQPGLPDTSKTGNMGKALERGIERLGELAMKIPMYREEVKQKREETRYMRAQAKLQEVLGEKELYNFESNKDYDDFMASNMELYYNADSGDFYSPQESKLFKRDAPDWFTNGQGEHVDVLKGRGFTVKNYINSRIAFNDMAKHASDTNLGMSKNQYHQYITDTQNALINEYKNNPQGFKEHFGMSQDEFVNYINSPEAYNVLNASIHAAAASKSVNLQERVIGAEIFLKHAQAALASAQTVTEGDYQKVARAEAVLKEKQKEVEEQKKQLTKSQAEQVEKATSNIPDYRGFNNQLWLRNYDMQMKKAGYRNEQSGTFRNYVSPFVDVATAAIKR